MQFLNFHDMGLATLKIKKMGSWHLKTNKKHLTDRKEHLKKEKHNAVYNIVNNSTSVLFLNSREDSK